jgi:hypothetical protein
MSRRKEFVAVTEPSIVIAGLVLVLGAWLSVLRTVFTPQERASLMARFTARAVGAVMLCLARWVREPGREYLLCYATPLMLFAAGIVWFVADAVGFALLGRGISHIPVNLGELTCPFVLCEPAQRGPGLSVAAGAWLSAALLSTMLMFAAFVVHLARVASAYSRRERLISRLSAQATRTPDAEMMLGEYLAGGGRSNLGSMFGEWASWLADVQSTHLACPALIYSRSPNGVCWTGAAQIMLDCAALAQACAPSWVPPQTGSLLTVGVRCLPRVAARLGMELPAVPVSYQGREGRPFAGTLKKIRAAGLPMEVDDERAQSAFQQLRVQYAPFANAICERLLFEYRDP